MTQEQFTLKAVQDHFQGLDGDTAMIVGILNGDFDLDEIEVVQEWCRQCYNEPNDFEKRLHILDALLGGYGVEGIMVEGALVGTYVNMGDTYNATVVMDGKSHDFILTTLGDFLEGWEQEQANRVA